MAVELGHPEDRKVRWLVAATYDRWLTARGRPQKYGTQFLKDAVGVLRPSEARGAPSFNSSAEQTPCGRTCTRVA